MPGEVFASLYNHVGLAWYLVICSMVAGGAVGLALWDTCPKDK